MKMNPLVSSLERISDGFTFLEGPVWHKDGYLLFSDIPEDKIIRFDPEEGFSVFRTPSGQSNGLTFDPKGNLIACEHANRRVSITQPDGTVIAIAERYQGPRLNSPNDCVSHSNGTVYFTDPPYGIQAEQKELDFNGIFRVSPGKDPVLLNRDFERPNGLAFSPDEEFLYVADTQRESIFRFKVTPLGDLTDETQFAAAGRPDGMKVDRDGNLFVASTEGIVIFNSQGDRICCLEMPERPSNCAFGEKDLKTLYITARTGLYRIRIHTPGITVWK